MILNPATVKTIYREAIDARAPKATHGGRRWPSRFM